VQPGSEPGSTTGTTHEVKPGVEPGARLGEQTGLESSRKPGTRSGATSGIVYDAKHGARLKAKPETKPRVSSGQAMLAVDDMLNRAPLSNHASRFSTASRTRRKHGKRVSATKSSSLQIVDDNCSRCRSSTHIHAHRNESMARSSQKRILYVRTRAMDCRHR
jgi:hypothetical protein